MGNNGAKPQSEYNPEECEAANVISKDEVKPQREYNPE